MFASNVFTLDKMQKCLPKAVYANFVSQIIDHKPLDRATADAIAHSVRIWAMDKGATHFTHIFQPQTDTTAEKHDSFLSFRGDTPVDAFSGSQLVQAEPDASSFPNGGTRTTFEARGYTVWDTTSPMYVQDGPNNTMILYVPSVFISYNGTALDEKTILLRSVEAVNANALRLLHLIGYKDVKRVSATLGTEQEFFLIDRGLYALRPDLKMTGRTLLGQLPPKHQQLEDHYFGKIPSRVLSTMSEAELELYKLGVPIKTRHNEVAPAQFEMAPIFEDCNVAVDHNMRTMDVIHRVAHRHKLKALFHEKPFHGINGSGKHCNWSMATDTGINLLEPTAHPEKNWVFLLSLCACLNAVHKYSALYRCSIASASNDHRLGGNEAPPSIISTFLGQHLDECLNSIEEGRPMSNKENVYTSIKVGGTILDVQVPTLPTINRDLTDRNRTSPFAFTGNKFEFRAVGAKQSPSFPVAVINSTVAASMAEITAALEVKKGTKDAPSEDDIRSVLKEFIKKTKAIRFEGDGYSDEWRNEAKRRGLPNFQNSTEAFKAFFDPAIKKMLVEDVRIFTEEELSSRYNVMAEKYAKDLLIEANTLKNMLYSNVLPAALETRKNLAEAAVNLKTLGVSFESEKNLLKSLGDLIASLEETGGKLSKAIETVAVLHDNADSVAASTILPLMNGIRDLVDRLEICVPDKVWPFPKLTDILFSI